MQHVFLMSRTKRKHKKISNLLTSNSSNPRSFFWLTPPNLRIRHSWGRACLPGSIVGSGLRGQHFCRAGFELDFSASEADGLDWSTPPCIRCNISSKLEGYSWKQIHDTPKADTYYWKKSEEGRRAMSLTIGMLLKSYHGFGSLIPSINE